jgi:hypothetical protein
MLVDLDGLFVVFFLELIFGLESIFLINEELGLIIVVIFVDELIEGNFVVISRVAAACRAVFIVELNVEPGVFVGFHR